MTNTLSKEQYLESTARKLNVLPEDVRTAYEGEGQLQDESLRQKIYMEFISGEVDVVLFAIIWQGERPAGLARNILYYDWVGQVMEGFNLYLHGTGYHVQVVSGNVILTDNAYLERLVSKRSKAGILLLFAGNLNVQAICDKYKIPRILLDPPANTNFDNEYTIRVDDVRLIMNSLSYLYELGHRRIAFLNGNLTNEVARARLDGYYQGLAQMELPVDEELVAGGNWLETGGYSAATQLLSHEERPTAIIASNDWMAIGAMRAIQDAGLRVPEDVSVTGVDDIAAAMQVKPQLTTVRIPMTKIGRDAAKNLIALIEGKEVEPRHQIVLTEFIIRDSTGVPRQDEPI